MDEGLPGSRITTGALPASEQAAIPGRKGDSLHQAPLPQLGCTQDPRQAAQDPSCHPMPASSTIRAVLDRHALVKRRKRLRYKAKPLSDARTPNACGAPTSKASSDSATGAIAILLLSPTTGQLALSRAHLNLSWLPRRGFVFSSVRLTSKVASRYFPGGGESNHPHADFQSRLESFPDYIFNQLPARPLPSSNHGDGTGRA